jgi:hypothetical protein
LFRQYTLTQARNRASGEADHTHRLVRSTRVGGTVRQVILLNLGRRAGGDAVLARQ